MIGLLGLIVLGAIAVIASVIAHSLIGGYLMASILAALASSLVFLALVVIDRGYQEPLFLSALFATRGIMAFAISLIIGLPFLFYRRSARKEGKKQEEQAADPAS